MNITITIDYQQKGFLISLAKLLSTEHAVSIVARDRNVANLVRLLAPELASNIDIYGDHHVEIHEEDVVNECLEREKNYGEFFSMLLSYDRALGKGYIFNADKHPDVIRSWWSHKKKLKSLLEKFIYYENIANRFNPKLIIGIIKDEIFNIVADKNNINYLSLGLIKFGNRFTWSDNNFITSSAFIEKIKRYAQDEFMPVDFSYTQEAGSKYNQSMARYSYFRAIKNALKRVAVETYQSLKGIRKKDSYRYLGWIPSIFRRPFMYNYFSRYGKTPEQLRDFRLIYIPLHLEPEITLLALSPEFNNSMEMIAWISKSVPADTLLVVKEQPFSFGIRSKHYYDNLRRIGNVVLANPRTLSWDWIKASSVVATFTGTAATEAVYFNRPVISFGKHQVVNHLPTARYANSYDTTRKYINELLELDPDDPVFQRSRQALYKSQMEVSFEMPGFERIYPSCDLHMDLARIAVDKIYEQYPELVYKGR